MSFHPSITRRETFKTPVNARLNLKSKPTYLIQLIGLVKLSAPLEIKVNVDHVGLFLLVVLLKDYMPSQLENLMSSHLNNLLIVLVDHMKMKDAMVDKWMPLSGMLLTTVLLLKVRILILGKTENADTLQP